MVAPTPLVDGFDPNTVAPGFQAKKIQRAAHRTHVTLGPLLEFEVKHRTVLDDLEYCPVRLPSLESIHFVVEFDAAIARKYTGRIDIGSVSDCGAPPERGLHGAEHEIAHLEIRAVEPTYGD